MICENIEFHNIAEINGGVLYRIPLSVCDALSVPTFDADGKFLYDYSGHRACARTTVGAELRFCADGDGFTLRIATEKSVDVTVFNGDFQCAAVRTVPGENTLAFERGDAVKGVGARSRNRFAASLWRVCLDGDGDITFRSLEAENVRPPRAEELPRLRLLAYGSSISQGCNSACQQLNYLSVCAQLLGADLANKSIAGGCFCEKEMSDYLLSEPYDALYLETGTNIADRPAAVIEERMGGLLRRACENAPGKPVFIVTPFPVFDEVSATAAPYKKNFARSRKVIEEVARNYKNAVLVEGRSLLDRDYYLCSDILHPSTFGQAMMGVNAAAILKKYLPVQK